MTAADDADDLARRLLLLSALAQRVAEAKAEVKDELERLMKPGTLLRPLLDGRPVGAVSCTVPRGRAEVYDPDQFAMWAMSHYPEHVTLQPTVDGDFRAAVVVASEQAGVAVSPLGDLDVAGVRAVKAAPTISARPDKNRTDELWAAIRDTTLNELGTT